MNQLLTCCDCGKIFDFTEIEQKRFTMKGWPAPKRCHEHRVAKAKKWEEIKGKEVAYRLAKGERVTLN